MQEDEIPEPEDHPDLEAERAFANAVIVEGMKRNPERAREVIADVARSFAERYSADEVSAAVDQLLAASLKGGRQPPAPEAADRLQGQRLGRSPGERSNGRNREIHENPYQSTTYDTELGGIGPAALRRPYRGRRAVI